MWRDLTRKGNKRVHSTRDFSKALTNPRFIKQCATLVNFMLCYQNIFLPMKFNHYIYADDQGRFWQFLHFASLAAIIRMYYRNAECRNTTVWMFNSDRNFKVRNDSTIATDFQDSRPWRHCDEVFRRVAKQPYAGQWRTLKIFMGRFHLVVYGGQLYLVCAVCDVTIWRHISKPSFWRKLLT